MKDIREEISKLLLAENTKREMIIGYLEDYERKINDLTEKNKLIMKQLVEQDYEQLKTGIPPVIKKQMSYIKTIAATVLCTILIEFIRNF